MKKKVFLFVLPLFLTIAYCGGEITNPGSTNILNDLITPLSKASSVLINGKVLAFSPIIGEIKIKVIEQTDTKIVTSITGISRFVVTPNENSEIKVLITGNIREIVFEQVIDGEKYSAARIVSIDGDISQKQVYGNSAFDWYYGNLMKIADDGDCEDDEFCEENVHPYSPYVIKCIEGRCEFVLPDEEL